MVFKKKFVATFSQVEDTVVSYLIDKFEVFFQLKKQLGRYLYQHIAFLLSLDYVLSFKDLGQNIIGGSWTSLKVCQEKWEIVHIFFLITNPLSSECTCRGESGHLLWSLSWILPFKKNVTPFLFSEDSVPQETNLLLFLPSLIWDYHTGVLKMLQIPIIFDHGRISPRLWY